MEPRSVLVTGGGGFIGKHLRPLLERQGLNVVSLDYRPAQPGSDPTCYQCDITDSQEVEAIFRTPSVRVSLSPGVHLAHSIQTGSAQGNAGEHRRQPEFAGGGEAIPGKQDDLCQFGQRLRHAARLELRIRGPTLRAGRCVRGRETLCGSLGRGLPAELWS